MNKFVTLFATTLLLGINYSASAVVGQGYPEQCVDTQSNPINTYWEVCIDPNDDADKGRNKTKPVISYMKVWDEILQRWVRLRGSLTGGMAVFITGPLGSRPHAESVSIAPPTDARFQVSDDANPNTVANPIWTQLSQDGANAVDATHPLPMSKDLSANAVSNPMWFQISQDGANAVDATHPLPISDDLSANAVSNPMWFQISQDGANAVDATHPLPISDDLSANAINNPMYFQISQDGATAVGAANPLPISQDMAANAINNPIYTQLSQDGTNAVDATHPLPISDDMSANAVNNPLWFQISQDGATAVGAANPLPISSTMAANTLANTIKVELSDGAAAFLDNTASPGYIRTQDGDSTVLQDVLDTSADGISTALNSEMSFCVGGSFNGATIDMDRNSATKAKMVNVENHPAAFDEANAWVSNRKAETAVNAPAKESTATSGGASATTVMASRYVLNDVNFCMYYKNAGANALTDAGIEISPDNTLWIPLTWTSCDSLAAGSGCVYCVTGNAYAYVRGRATAAAGSETTIEAFYTSNKG